MPSTARATSQLTPGALYRPCQGDQQNVIWMRPLADFLEQVTTADGLVPGFAPATGKIDPDPPLSFLSR